AARRAGAPTAGCRRRRAAGGRGSCSAVRRSGCGGLRMRVSWSNSWFGGVTGLVHDVVETMSWAGLRRDRRGRAAAAAGRADRGGLTRREGSGVGRNDVGQRSEGAGWKARDIVLGLADRAAVAGDVGPDGERQAALEDLVAFDAQAERRT